LSLMVEDSPCALVLITGILGEFGVSIVSITQKDHCEKCIPLVIMTDEVKVGLPDGILEKISVLSVVREMPYRFRIEDID